MAEKTLTKTNMPEAKLFSRGKVRDLYESGENLVIVTTDRISAFDFVLPNAIPGKGRVLTSLSEYWFNFTRKVIPNHLITTNVDEFPEPFGNYRSQLEGRSMLVKKVENIPVECVVRGYLAGSGWREYRESGETSGVKLPEGLVESQKLDEPVFTPATKAATGHDENISEKQLEDRVGKETAAALKDSSLRVYLMASEYARQKGIIISDTKMEFGFLDGELILIDELLTPDSSRFWPLEDYQPGTSQKSFDKQFVRDYLESIGWDKKPPVPELTEEVIQKTAQKYQEAYERIVG